MKSIHNTTQNKIKIDIKKTSGFNLLENYTKKYQKKIWQHSYVSLWFVDYTFSLISQTQNTELQNRDEIKSSKILMFCLNKSLALGTLSSSIYIMYILLQRSTILTYLFVFNIHFDAFVKVNIYTIYIKMVLLERFFLQRTLLTIYQSKKEQE